MAPGLELPRLCTLAPAVCRLRRGPAFLVLPSAYPISFMNLSPFQAAICKVEPQSGAGGAEGTSGLWGREDKTDCVNKGHRLLIVVSF